jgi:hypothetical protein
MMKEIKIENIILSLSSEGGDVRVKSNKEDVILSNQDVDVVSELIVYNFNVVNNHYKKMIEKAKEKFDYSDVTPINIVIVLHYLYLYNSWRSMYHKQENRDLKFNEKDFTNPSTYDIVFNHFKIKYPNDWEDRCAILLGMGLSELKAYYNTREDFITSNNEVVNKNTVYHFWNISNKY